MLQLLQTPDSRRTTVRPEGAPARTAGALARRRRALLELARRHGEVRLRTLEAGRVVPGAAEMSELLDMLNEDGLVRYGGRRFVAGGCELVYLAA